MHDVEFKPPVEERELREMLAELDVALDEALIPRLLAAVQPIRGKLRSESPGQRRALLVGAAITAGWIPPGRVRVSPDVAVQPEEPQQAPTLGNLVTRLVGISLAVVAGLFALITMGAPWLSIPFACMAGLLLFSAVTGWGTGDASTRRAARRPSSGQSTDGPARRARSLVGPIVAIVLLYVTGIGNLLLIAVRSVFDPRFYAEGDFITRAFQVVGLLVIFVVASHVVRARRRATP